MSNLKKVISLLLCLSMLAGMVAILDGAFVPTASAASAEPVTHKIKTMEQLNAEYGNKGFYYLGLEFYESNGKPTRTAMSSPATRSKSEFMSSRRSL